MKLRANQESNNGRMSEGRGRPVRQTVWHWADLWAVAAVALVVRIIYQVHTEGVPSLRHLVGDARGYYEWAARVAGGDWLGTETFYQAPLYPYLLAGIRVVAGEGVEPIRLVQACWGAVAAACLCVAGRRLFSRPVGLLAGGLWALYPPAIFFDGIVQKASLAGALSCVLVMLAAGVRKKGNTLRVALLGCVAGLLVLVRENAAIWAGLLMIWVVWMMRGRGWGKGVANVAVLAGSVGVVLLPIGVRNMVVGGEWSVSTFQMGPNFYIGNHRGADGRYTPMVRGHETPAFERKDAARLAEEALGQSLTAGEVSRFWLEATFSEIRADPSGWVALMGTKLLMVVNRYEVADAESMVVYGLHAKWLGTLGCIWHFGTLCALAAMGVPAAWHLRHRMWLYCAMVVSMAVAIALFFVLARYRFVLVPPLIVFAAVALEEFVKLIRQRRYGALLGRCGVGLVMAVIANLPIHNEECLDALAHMNVGVALAQANELDAALAYFQCAADGCPDSAEARNNLAQALSIQGRFEEGIPHYVAALSLEPGLVGVEYNLAVALERVGAFEESLEYYQRALKLDPGDKGAAAAVARLKTRS